jgi:hemolysin activation/secretion protein
MHLRNVFVCTVVAAISSQQASAQTTPPVGAGQLLEQQRSLEQDPRPPQKATLPDTTLAPKPVAPAEPPELGGIKTMVRQFTLRGHAELSEADLQAALLPWLGSTVGLRELRQAATALEQIYRARGWLAKVTLPSQDVTDGTIILNIVEAKRGRIQLTQTGTPKPGSAKAAERVQSLLEGSLPEGQALNLNAYERALLIANDLPGGTSSGSLQASETEGRTDLLVQKSTDSRPPQIDISADNGGSRVTGDVRLNANVNFDAPWGYGEQITLAASKTQGSEYLRGAASWPISFPGFSEVSRWNGWRMGINASLLEYRVLDNMNTSTGVAPEGSSQTFGAELQYPIVRNAMANWQLNLGLEGKQLRNQDDNTTLGVLEVASTTNTRAVTLGLSGYQFDTRYGGGNNQASVVLTLGKTNLDGSPAAFVISDRQTTNTQGDFQKLRYYVARSQVLTATGSLHASLSGQWASKNLDAGEKIYLGGMSGVRAYPSGEAGGSSGQIISLELRQQLNAQWQAIAFYDYGQVAQFQHNQKAEGSAALVANNNVALSGAGLSLGWRSNQGVQLKATWAQRLGSNPLATPNGNDTDGSLQTNRFWLTASVPF